MLHKVQSKGVMRLRRAFKLEDGRLCTVMECMPGALSKIRYLHIALEDVALSVLCMAGLLSSCKKALRPTCPHALLGKSWFHRAALSPSQITMLICPGMVNCRLFTLVWSEKSSGCYGHESKDCRRTAQLYLQ